MDTSKLETNTETIERLTRERDVAQAAGAEMRDALEEISICLRSHLNGCPDCAIRAGKILKSTDCGKHHFHVRELEQTTTLLRQASSELRTTHAFMAQTLWEEARRLTALKEGK